MTTKGIRYEVRYIHVPGHSQLDGLGWEIETRCYSYTAGHTYASEARALHYGEAALKKTKAAYRQLGGSWRKFPFPRIDVTVRRALGT
jgi:hypothetical protein